METRRKISPLFHSIFTISLTSEVKLHIHLWNVVVWFILSSILQIWYVEVRISWKYFRESIGQDLTVFGFCLMWITEAVIRLFGSVYLVNTCLLGNKFSRWHFKIFFLFFPLCMKCQILFSNVWIRKNRQFVICQIFPESKFNSGFHIMLLIS